jgi:hypothetical protein
VVAAVEHSSFVCVVLVCFYLHHMEVILLSVGANVCCMLYHIIIIRCSQKFVMGKVALKQFFPWVLWFALASHEPTIASYPSAPTSEGM